MKYKKLDWNEYHAYIDGLADKIKSKIEEDPDSEPYKYVAGLETDDMVVAVHIGHRLNIPVITDINLLTMLTNFTNGAESLLVVANIVETGKTFNSIQLQLEMKFDTAVLFKDKNSQYTPTYCCHTPSDYILFPWQ
jgi:hypoxanthine phosphoribosyltransferase